ncbi:MAG: hypothetical protein WBM32_02120 [Crocosphaera sp.]
MNETKNKLASYVNALTPIIYINHFDFPLLREDQIAQIIQKFAQQLGFRIEKNLV